MKESDFVNATDIVHRMIPKSEESSYLLSFIWYSTKWEDHGRRVHSSDLTSG